MSTQAVSSALSVVQVEEDGDLASLLKKEFKPRTDDAGKNVEQAVLTLAQHALADTKLVNNDAAPNGMDRSRAGLALTYGASTRFMRRTCAGLSPTTWTVHVPSSGPGCGCSSRIAARRRNATTLRKPSGLGPRFPQRSIREPGRSCRDDDASANNARCDAR